MSLSKYKFVAGEAYPAENANSYDPRTPKVIGKLLGGQNISPLAKWAVITAPVSETEEIAITTPSSDYGMGSPDVRISQSFTATKEFLTYVLFYINRNNTPVGDLYVDLYADNGSNEPTGAVLATSQVANSAITSGECEVCFNKVQLTVGNKYCLVLRHPGQTASNQFAVYYGGSYAGGQGKYSTNAGSSWSNLGDLYFKVYMATAPDSYPRYSINVDGTLYANNYLKLPYQSERKAIFALDTDNYTEIYSTLAVGQTFMVVDRNYFSKCVVNLARYGSPTGNVTLGIYETSGGYPTGSPLATVDVAVGGLSTSQTAVTFTFASLLALDIGKQYAIKITMPGGASSSNCLRVYHDSTGIYEGGSYISYNGSWSSNAYDLTFSLYGALVTPVETIADLLQAQIRLLTSGTETVEYVDDRFIIKTADSVLALISPASGIDISGNDDDGATGYYLDLGTNAVATARDVDPDDIVRVGTDHQVPSEILSNAIKVDILQTTHDFPTISVRETIPHGLGRLPKLVEATARYGSANTIAHTSDGFSDGSDNKCSYIVDEGVGANPYPTYVGGGNSADSAIFMRRYLSSGSSGYIQQKGVITFDEYNIYIDWTRVVSGAYTTITGTFYVTLLVI